ncbi:MAG: hypothetical protein C4297_12845 [Gemmataceae bacterium]
MSRCVAYALCSLSASGLILSVALAQSKQADLAPVLQGIFPPAVHRGVPAELTLVGNHLDRFVSLLTDVPAKVTVVASQAHNLRVRLEVAPDAPSGLHGLRVVTSNGVSNMRLFAVDDVPIVLEEDGHHTAATAQSIPTLAAVCGRAEAEKADFYRVALRKGQRLTFEVLGRRLGTPFDPLLLLHDRRTGQPVAYADDTPGLSRDARLTWVSPEDGEYSLEVRDVRYQGGPDWHYVLRVGDFPCATTAFPLVVRRGSQTRVHFAGRDVQSVQPVLLALPGETPAASVPLVPVREGAPPGWPVEVFVSDLPQVVEVEPNDEVAAAQPIAWPTGINGRLEKKGDRDHFRLRLEQGQAVVVTAQTVAMHSPAAVFLQLLDDKGRKQAASDPTREPARIEFQAPAAGDYILAVEHLQFWGGPEETYYLEIAARQPDFELELLADRVSLCRGDRAIVEVQAHRRGYDGPIEINAVAGQGVIGSARIAPGQSATLLELQAADDLPLGGRTVYVVGHAVLDGRVSTRLAHARAALRTSLNQLAYPPAYVGQALAVGVMPASAFHIAVTYRTPEGVRGLAVPVQVHVQRATGFDGEIRLEVRGPSPLPGQQPVLPPVTATIAAKQNQATIQLQPTLQAPLGALPVAFVARAAAGGQAHVSARLAPLNLVLPFDLAVEPDQIALEPGGKAKLRVRALRKGGYQGPIVLALEKLPDKVSASQVTLGDRQESVELELAATADAPATTRADVRVVGTAPAAGGQQNRSAPLRVAVVKK